MIEKNSFNDSNDVDNEWWVTRLKKLFTENIHQNNDNDKNNNNVSRG